MLVLVLFFYKKIIMVLIIQFVTFLRSLTNIRIITIEKECLALILAIQQFEVYLTSSTSPIVVFSDHNPLSFLHKLKSKNQRLLRWSLLLQEFNHDIRHIKGKDNIIPDVLSKITEVEFIASRV